ncbi:MAG: DNA topoisomerase IV subunit B [Candidatus Portiera sp.]|nr:DNA topoisomerase IV subunit B [Portiera sp.]
MVARQSSLELDQEGTKPTKPKPTTNTSTNKTSDSLISDILKSKRTSVAKPPTDPTNKGGTNIYDASSIEVLSGLEPVYTRPGMYTDTSSPNHIAQEVIDNGVDEALAGHAKHIEVMVNAGGEMIVTDDGRGMPVDIHPQHNISGVELILTRLHSGAKFSSKSYKFSGGLHGVGVSVTNALSDNFRVEIWKDSKKYLMKFANGKKLGELTEENNTEDKEKGTRITFIPNKKYFDSGDFSVPHLRHLMRSKAVLCNGLRTTFIDNRGGKLKKDTWRFNKGAYQYVKEGLAKQILMPEEPWVYETNHQFSELLVALAWTPQTTHSLTESYVNLIPTIMGGTHVNHLRTGIYEAVKEFSEQRNLIDKNLRLNSDDIWQNCNYLLSVKIENPHFAGQTKEKLSSDQQTSFVATKVKDAFILWLNSHPKQGEQLAKLAIFNANERLKRARQADKNRNKFLGILPSKLSNCLSNKPHECELFLVEGDSAGGSAKQARDKKTQAIMPLRGKILNTWELSLNRIMESQEVQNIIKAIGVMPEDDDLSNLRYDKICILADADSDGMHISSLLCALFVKHFKILVQERKIHIAMPPLYRIDQGKKVFYALDEKEKDKQVKELSKQSGNISIQRFKGLGEMNPIQLRETTMDPVTRRLVALEMSDESVIEHKMSMLFSKGQAEDRRKWIEDAGELAQIAQ